MTQTQAPIDERYFDWLYDLVVPVRTPIRHQYRRLCRQLFVTPFTWFVPNDDNRVEDARELRILFYQWSKETQHDRDWIDLDASVFEVLIALAQRYAFETDEAPGQCFFEFLERLELLDYTDIRWSIRAARRVEDNVSCFVDRTYESNGAGGLFPLANPREDQREVELWYQMSAYVLERMP